MKVLYFVARTYMVEHEPMCHINHKSLAIIPDIT